MSSTYIYAVNREIDIDVKPAHSFKDEDVTIQANGDTVHYTVSKYTGGEMAADLYIKSESPGRQAFADRLTEYLSEREMEDAIAILQASLVEMRKSREQAEFDCAEYTKAMYKVVGA